MRARASWILALLGLACAESTGTSPPGKERLELAPAAATLSADAASCAIAPSGLHCWGHRSRMPDLGPSWTPRGRVWSRERRQPFFHVRTNAAPVAVSAGDGRDRFAGCVVSADGSVECWGSNRDGGLGLGRCGASGGAWGSDGLVPVRLPHRASAVVTLGERVCALLEGGRVACWGSVTEGTVGSDHCGPRLVRMGRSPLQGMKRISIDAGIDSEGGLHVWDEGDAARRLASDLRFVDVASAGDARCAITTDHRGVCWGALPIYADDAPRPAHELTARPTPIHGLPRVSRVSCTLNACAAAGMDGRLYAWGAIGVPGERKEARAAARIGAVSELALGDAGGCARTARGLVCWGRQLDGLVEGWESDPHPRAVHPER